MIHFSPENCDSKKPVQNNGATMMSSLRCLIIFDNGIENGVRLRFFFDKENWPYISRTVIRATLPPKAPNDNICTKKKNRYVELIDCPLRLSGPRYYMKM